MTQATVASSPTPTSESVAAALDATSSQWLPGNEIQIHCARFPGGTQVADGTWVMSKYGDNTTLNFMTWEAQRREAAARPWPDDAEKLSLPYEVGAILATENGRARRRARDVVAFTWIFIDSDTGQSATALREALQALNICFMLTESATSRSNGNPAKFHLFLPLSTPKTLPSMSLPEVDVAAATLAACKTWWHNIHRHVVRCLFTLGGMSEAVDAATTQQPSTSPQHSPVSPLGDDSTASTLARLAYVPHRPAGGPPRHLVANEGRLLCLDEFLRATGFDGSIDAPIVMLPAVAAAKRRRSVAAGDVGDVTTAAAVPGDDTDTTDSPYSADATTADGLTADETTGTLLYKALDFFGLAGPQLEPGKYRALCPWRVNHTKTAQHDPEGFTPNDSSVVFWTRDVGSRAGGGWKCQHHGNGIAGQCAQSSAADVLRWARRHGCPLPDSTAWAGGGAMGAAGAPTTTQQPDVVAAASAAAVPAAPAPAPAPIHPLPPAFPGAPANGAPVSPPPRGVAATAAKPLVDIEITTDLLAMRRGAIAALANHSAFYKINGTLYDLVEEEGEDRFGNPKRPWLRKSVAPHVTAELCSVSRWFTTETARKQPIQVDKTPDRQTVATVLAAGAYPGMRELNGIITTPVFRRGPDYSLVQTPGYDQSLGVLYRPVGYIPRVSTNPGRPQLEVARAELLRLIKDFPFRVIDRDLCKSVWLAAIFTRFLRFTFTGNIPMFLVSAGAAGSGKGKLIDAAAIISDGAEAWKRTKAGDDAELERAIGAAIREEVPVAVLDNIPRGVILESATLENYLTTPIFTTREIGTSKNIKGVKGGWNDTLWWGNGNGLQTGGDMSRRVLRIDIEDKTGRPESRRPEIPELEAHCHAHRAELLSHALTLLCGFFAARRAGWSVRLPPFASFEGWSIVREAVVWCGLPDPYLARGKADDDVDTANFCFLVDHLVKWCGVGKETGVGEIAEGLIRDKASATSKHREFYNFLVEVCDVKLGKQDGAATSLGKLLCKYDKRVVPDGKWQLLHYRTPRGSKVQISDVTVG